MKTRKDVLIQAIDECVREMYELSQPPGDLTEIRRLAKEGLEDEKHPFYKQHFLPQEIFTEILESYMDAYGVKSTWNYHVDTIKDYLKNGGTYTDYSDGKKTYRHTEKLEDLIGKEHAEIVFNLINKCQGYYLFNGDENTFRFNVCLGSSPTSNRKTVEEYWSEKNGEQFKVNDREDWKEIFCYPECQDDEDEE